MRQRSATKRLQRQRDEDEEIKGSRGGQIQDSVVLGMASIARCFSLILCYSWLIREGLAYAGKKRACYFCRIFLCLTDIYGKYLYSSSVQSS